MRGRPTPHLAAALRIAVAAALVGLAAACGAATRPDGGNGKAPVDAAALSASDLTISETGSTLLYPLAKTWAAAYHQQHPGVTVSTAGTGSGAGIEDASDGKAEIGASDAYLSSGDLVTNPRLLNIPLAVSAQTVIYNVPDLPAGSHVQLTGNVLADIYRGSITRWNDQQIKALNRGLPLPGLTIVPLHRSDRSGDTFLFTSYLSTQDTNWDTSIGYGTTANWPKVAGALAEKGSLAIVQRCAATPGCIAYNGISYLGQAQSANLGEAALANAAKNFTLPTATAINDSVNSFVSLTPPNETISMIDGPSADGYPIVNYEYAVVSTSQPNAGVASAIRNFLRWVITTGNHSSYLNPVNFQPLSPTVTELAQDQIGEIGP
ncbi:MAG TPA: phosphate ABC transporter substrate-binding protein PstS [Trebonia sp.]|nr:phosphate ABC transporter substrate-binding protein PstS [Trebonia sp.]